MQNTMYNIFFKTVAKMYVKNKKKGKDQESIQ